MPIYCRPICSETDHLGSCVNSSETDATLRGSQAVLSPTTSSGDRRYPRQAIQPVETRAALDQKAQAIHQDNELKALDPNLVKDRIPSRPELVWVADITYTRSKKGFE